MARRSSAHPGSREARTTPALHRPKRAEGARDRDPVRAVWSAVQAQLGNRHVAALREGGPRDAFELRVMHLIRVAEDTGLDVTSYLPWTASASWNEQIAPYYELLQGEIMQGERALGGLLPSGFLGEAAPLGLSGTSASGWEMGSFEPGAMEGAQVAEQAAAPVMRKARGEAQEGEDIVAWFDSLLASAGPGRALNAAERDLVGDVHGKVPSARVHHGALARRLSRLVNARAFTVGRDIYMGEGDGSVSSADEAELLVHEATHVLQHEQGRLPPERGAGLQLSTPDQAHEKEAEAAGVEGRERWQQRQSTQDLWDLAPTWASDEAGRHILASLQSALPEGDALTPDDLANALNEVLQQQLSGKLLGLRMRVDALAAEGQVLPEGLDELRDWLSKLEGTLRASQDSPQGQLRSLLDLAGEDSGALLDGLRSPSVDPVAFNIAVQGVLGDALSAEAPLTDSLGAGALESAPLDLGAVDALDQGAAGPAVETAVSADASLARLSAPAMDLGGLQADTGVSDALLAELGGAFDQLLLDVIGSLPQELVDATGLTRLTQGGLASALSQELPAERDTAVKAQIGGATTAMALQLARSGERRSLPYAREMEARFGVDLSRVEVHSGPAATLACQMVGAEAFTVKNIVVFRDAAPSREVVAHELTHVIQQGGHLPGGGLSAIPSALPMSRPGDAAEREAEQIGAQNPAGAPLDLAQTPGTGGSTSGFLGDTLGAAGAIAEATGGPSLDRMVDVSGTQAGVLGDLVQSVLPEGAAAQVEQFKGIGDGIQSAIGQTQGLVDGVRAFPVDNVTSLFEGDSYSFLDPSSFMESLKPTGDNFVEQTVSVVAGLCEGTIGVLQGVIGTVNKILGVIRFVVDLLNKASQVLLVIATVLAAIAAALAATLFGSGAAAVLFQIANQCRSVSSTLGNIASTIENSVLKPIEPFIERLNKIIEMIRQVAEVCKIIQAACDVYDWLTADTAAERDAVAQDIMANVGNVGSFIGGFEGQRFTQFAQLYWEGGLPALGEALAGEVLTEAGQMAGQALAGAVSEGGGEGGGAGGAGMEAGPSAEAATGPATEKPPESIANAGEGESNMVEGPGNRGQEAASKYKEFEAEAEASAQNAQSDATSGANTTPSSASQSTQSTPAPNNTGTSTSPPQTQGGGVEGQQDRSDEMFDGAEEARRTASSDGSPESSPAAQAQQEGAQGGGGEGEQAQGQGEQGALGEQGEKQSAVEGAQGTAMAPQGVPLQAEGERGQPQGADGPMSGQGYPDGVAQIFDLLNGIEEESLRAEDLSAQTAERKEEAGALSENASSAINWAQNQLRITAQQRQAAQADQAANTEGMNFMQLLQAQAQGLQADIQAKMEQALFANQDSQDSGNSVLGFSMSGDSQGMSGQSAGAGVMGIIQKVSTALLSSVLNKILEKINLNKIIEQLIPKDLAMILNMVMNFASTAQGAFDQAVAKEAEAAGAQAVLGNAQATDLQAQAGADQNEAELNRIIDEANQNKETAAQAEAQAADAEAQAQTLRADLEARKAEAEAQLESELAEDRPLRPRTAAPPGIDMPPGYGFSVGGEQAPEDAGPMVSEGGQLEAPQRQTGEVPEAGAQGEGEGQGGAQAQSEGEGGAGPEGGAQGEVEGAEGPQGEQEASGGEEESQTSGGTGGGQGAAQGGGDGPQANAAMNGGGGGGGGGASGEHEYVVPRDLAPDLDEGQAAVEAREEDPAPPPSSQEMRAQVAQPAEDLMGTQRDANVDAVNQVAERLPEGEALHAALPEMPTVTAPEIDLQPMATGGLGGEDGLLADGDVAQIQAWASAQPTQAQVLGEATGEGGALPELTAAEVETGQLEAPPEIESGEAPALNPEALPHPPLAEEINFDRPDLLAAAGAYAGLAVVTQEYEEALRLAEEAVNAFKEREEARIARQQGDIEAIQDEQQQQTEAARAERDTQIDAQREQWVANQEQAVNDVESQASQARTDAMDGARRRLEEGQSSAEARIAEGNARAQQIQNQAQADADAKKAEAEAEAQGFWGWVKSKVDAFVASVCAVIEGIWDAATRLIQSALDQARQAAEALLDAARGTALGFLADAVEGLKDLYNRTIEALQRFAQAALEAITGFIDWAIQAVTELAQQAWQAIQDAFADLSDWFYELMGGLEGELDEIWEEFSQFTEDFSALVPAASSANEALKADPEPVMSSYDPEGGTSGPAFAETVVFPYIIEQAEGSAGASTADMGRVASGEAVSDAVLDESGVTDEANSAIGNASSGTRAEGNANGDNPGGGGEQGANGSAGEASQVNASVTPGAPGAGSESATGERPQPFQDLKGGPLCSWDDELVWHDFFQGMSPAPEALQSASETPGPVVQQSMSFPDRLALVGEALGSGALSGFVSGATSLAIDTAINVASSKIPYVAGIVELGKLIYDPAAWFDGNILQNANKVWDQGLCQMFSSNASPIDRIEGFINVLDGVNGFIGTLSTICWIIAGAGFIASWFFPPLFPFVAMAAQWGMTLGTISTIFGAYVTVLRLMMVLLRSVEILMPGSSPEELEEMAGSLRSNTEAFTSQWTARAGNAMRGRVQDRMQGGPQRRAATQSNRNTQSTQQPASRAKRWGAILIGNLGTQSGSRMGEANYDGSSTFPTRRGATEKIRNELSTATNMTRTGISSMRNGETTRQTLGAMQSVAEQGGSGIQIPDRLRERINRADAEAMQRRSQYELRGAENRAAGAQRQQQRVQEELEAAMQQRRRTQEELDRVQAQDGPALDQAKRALADDQEIQRLYQQDVDGLKRQIADAQELERMASWHQQWDQRNAGTGQYDSMVAEARSSRQALQTQLADRQATLQTARDNVAASQQRVTTHEERLRTATSNHETSGQRVEQGLGQLQPSRDRVAETQGNLSTAQQNNSAADAYAANPNGSPQGFQNSGRDEGYRWYTDLTGQGGGPTSGHNKGSGVMGAGGSFVEQLYEDATGRKVNEDVQSGVTNFAETASGYFSSVIEAAPPEEGTETAPTPEATPSPETAPTPEGGATPEATPTPEAPSAEERVDYSALFQQQFSAVQGSLPAPPLQAPNQIDAAAYAYDELGFEVEALSFRLGLLDELVAEGNVQREELSGTQQVISANQQTITQFEAASDDRMATQAQAKGKAGELGSQASQGQAKTSEGGGLLGGFISPFLRMLGVVPSRLVSSTGEANQAIQGLQSGQENQQQILGEASGGAGQLNTTLDDFTTRTQTVKGEATAISGELDGVNAEVEQHAAQTDTGIGELEAQKAETADKLTQTQGEMGRLQGEHAASVGEASGWASGHAGVREPGIAELERIISEAEQSMASK